MNLKMVFVEGGAPLLPCLFKLASHVVGQGDQCVLLARGLNEPCTAHKHSGSFWPVDRVHPSAGDVCLIVARPHDGPAGLKVRLSFVHDRIRVRLWFGELRYVFMLLPPYFIVALCILPAHASMAIHLGSATLANASSGSRAQLSQALQRLIVQHKH